VQIKIAASLEVANHFCFAGFSENYPKDYDKDF